MTQDNENDIKTTNFSLDLLRVTPNKSDIPPNKHTDRLTDFVMILLIFSISLWFRFYSRELFIDVYGINTFHLKIDNEDPLNFGNFLRANPGDTVFTEGYYDFYTYYIPYVNAYEESWNPYSGSRVAGDNIGGYVYGPFYMISISIGKLWFNLSTVDSIVYSNLILDSLTYVMIYIIAKRYTGNIFAFIIAILGSFSPISLFYIAYRGLNAPIMNFSFLVFVWAYLERKDNLSMFMLAFSLLTKQFPLFMAMPAGFWMVRRYGFFKGVGYYLRFFIYVLCLSIPYILWDPRSYIIRLFIPGGGKDDISCPSNSEATNLFHGTIPLDACFDNNTRIPIDLDLLPIYSDFVFSIVNSHFLFFFSLFVIAWIGFTGYDYLEEKPKLYLVFLSAYYGIAHATIARGIYKYYLTFIVPIFILGLISNHNTKSLNLKLGQTLNQSIRLFLNSKYRTQKVSFMYWVHATLVLLSFVGLFIVIDFTISLATFYKTNSGIYYLFLILICIYFIINPTSSKTGSSQNSSFKSSKIYFSQLSIYSIIYSILVYISFNLSQLYFTSIEHSIYNFILILIIPLTFVLLPYSQSKIINTDEIQSPITKIDIQFIKEIFSILVLCIFILFFNYQILIVHRFYSTLTVFLFSFIYMALLGSDIWLSSYKVPVSIFNQYKKMKNYQKIV